LYGGAGEVVHPSGGGCRGGRGARRGGCTIAVMGTGGAGRAGAGRLAGGRGQARGPASRLGEGGLRLARATSDQLTVAWDRQADVAVWQVVCWDSRAAPVARIRLGAKHRRATVAGLAALAQPFTISISGIDGDGRILWQAGLGELRLDPRRRLRREAVPDRRRGQEGGTNARGRRRTMAATKGAKAAAPAGTPAGRPKQ